MSGKGWLKRAIAVLLAILAVSSTPTLAQEAEGWAISPGEVPMNGIRLGESRSNTITVYNNKDFPVTFSMSAEIPQAGNLRPEYESIPDTDWITFDSSLVELDAHSRQEVIVTVTIPSNGDWGGQNYECWLRATFEVIGIFQVELDCRLLISTSTAYAGGIDWILMGVIAGAVVVTAAVAYSNRRALKKWAGRW